MNKESHDILSDTIKRYCSECFDMEAKRYSRNQLDKSQWLCNIHYMRVYNQIHKQEKRVKSRLRMRLLKSGTRVKGKKKQTQTQQQIQNINRQLKYQVKKAELKAEVIKYLYAPSIPNMHNDTNRSQPPPGVG